MTGGTMALINQTYDSRDLVEQDIDIAPSLDLPDIMIEKYFRPKDNADYLIFFVNPKNDVMPGECPNCKTDKHWKRAGNGSLRLIHDVERSNYRVDIVLLPKRFECKQCGIKITPPLRGIEEKVQATTRLMEFLRKECLLQSHTALAQRSGFSIDTIQNIMHEEIRKLDENRIANPLPAPRVLGIDEKHITHKMRGTLVDVETGRLLNMLEDNRSTTMQEGIMQLKNWDTNIEVVTTDMNNAYINWLTKFLPNAKVVIDKFHVIQDIQKRISTTKSKLYEYRKNLIKNLEDPKEIVRQRDLLHEIDTHSRLFNYSMETLVREDKAKLAVILANVIEAFPEFRLLREIYAGIEELYRQETPEEAEAVWDKWVKLLPPNGEKQYEEWCDLYSVTPPLFNDFRTFQRRGFQRFKPYILNYFEPGCRVTNAATEGVNTLIERINREGNGLKFEALRAKSLYASLVNERIRYGIDLKTISAWKPTMNCMFKVEDTFEEEQFYTLTTFITPFRLQHTNVLTDNEDFFDLFDEDKSAHRLYGVDEKSLSNFADQVWSNNMDYNGSN